MGRNLCATEVSVNVKKSRLALGTVQFGLDYGIANSVGRVTCTEARAIIRQAELNGLDTLDTAIAYGGSEDTLGSVGVEYWNVVTKLPMLPADCHNVDDWAMTQIKQSLFRLGIPQLKGVLLHSPEDLLGRNGKSLVRALERIKAEGFARQIGVSVYAPEQLETLSKIMALDLVQAPLNVLDDRLIASGWSGRLKDQGTEIHVRSAFLQGLLLMPSGQRPTKFSRWADIWAEWSRWLESNGLTSPQACLAYVLSFAEVDRVIIGVDSLTQLNEIFTASHTTFTSLPDWPQPIDTNLINPARWSQL
jgi:aryl-alcohol dehydrogenase-like predicted oxidoreductase